MIKEDDPPLKYPVLIGGLVLTVLVSKFDALLCRFGVLNDA